jgi:hypothetical protein
MRANIARSLTSAPTKKFMNVKVPTHIHARFMQECQRLSKEVGGRFSLNMLFVRFGNTLPPAPDENEKQSPARAGAVIRARSA